MHGGYARFYDNWAGLTENQSNYTQLWPNVAFIGAPGGFNLFGPPTGLANDPFTFGNNTWSKCSARAIAVYTSKCESLH